ncbi:hypothetical protein EYF80_065724 [Liparis tanakae]|uniref:Uncharacterized protein n=1 Tax=Liparis tanakae TaxID=230148 RepID=A0A4Z2E683_9TELE|nr:hypothetical protein EYF80_065724 [Liparis tanakae]
MGKPSILSGGWKGLQGASPFFPMMRLRDGRFWRPAPPAARPPRPGLSMTFRFRMIRPLLTSRGFTRRFRMRTVSENGAALRREGKAGAAGSQRGSGRRDMRWQRWMSFFSLWVAEFNLGDGATAEEEEEEDEAAEEEGGGGALPGVDEEDAVWRADAAFGVRV